MYSRYISKPKITIIKSTHKDFHKIVANLSQDNKLQNLKKIRSTGITSLYTISLFNKEILIKKSQAEISGNERIIKDFNNSWLFFKNSIPTPKPFGLIRIDVSQTLLNKVFFIFIREWSKGVELTNFLENGKDKEIKEVLKNSIKILAKIHSLNYIHTDFFPRNLLIKHDLSVEVFDFEHSREEKNEKEKLKEVINFIECIDMLHQKKLPKSFISTLMEIYFKERN